MYPTTVPPVVLNERVPDPAVKILDHSFEKYRLPLASVERISQGYSWAEGAVYFGDARCLLWSDIPNNRIMRWDEETGATSVYRKPSNYANGNTRDRQGRLVTAEHGRRVTRTEYDGRITVLMDRFDGKRITGPNDVVVKSDDSIWFTDPLIPAFYPVEMRSDQELSQSIADLIREAAIAEMKEEVPHSIAVVVDEFSKREDKENFYDIHASIVVERDSQKAIIIGKKGERLKQIGQDARSEIERKLGARIFLGLHVKVMQNWQGDPKALQRLGFTE